MQLFEQRVLEDGIYYFWNGEQASRNQRNMYPWYNHCSQVAELKKEESDLFEIRFRAIMKFFSGKDSTHANIYRHYGELRNWYVRK